MYIRNSGIQLSLLIICFIFSISGLAQNIPIETRLENILIKKDTSFVKNVSISLKKSDKTIIYPIFYDNELENLSDIQVYFKKGKRFKLVNHQIIEEDIELDYISSIKAKSVVIPSETEAKINYTIECPELMYFSDLRFFSYNEIDTLKYQITVPDTFRFIHNTIHKDSLDYIAIDSIRTNALTKWNIEVTPKKVHPNPLMFFGIYKNIKEPLMRTLIVPATFEDDKRIYLNDWYMNHVKARRGLDAESVYKIEELTKGITDPLKIIDTLYSYVKNNFKYVAIEIGMGAFIPTHVNEVFTNKQGDCKDLSNFLSEALKYKGIKSHIALAATYNHISDCDFPSLSSANHVICLAYLKDKPILLDPTDPIHLPETPIESLQTRSILIINDKGGEFYKTPSFSPNQNLIKYEIDLKAYTDQMLMEGEFKVKYEGISGNFLRREFLYTNDVKTNIAIDSHFKSVFRNQAIDDLVIDNFAKSIGVQGKISINGKIFKDGDNRLLFIDFLPRIFETEERETLLEGTHLGCPINKIVNLKILLDEPYHAFTPIEHAFSEKGVSLFLKITSHSELIIECHYEFVFDDFLIEKENLNITNEILTAFKKIINEPIIFKKKS